MYIYQIDTGSGWATVVPVVGSASLKTSRVAGQIFARTELDGVIKFTGTTANQLRGLSATKQTIPFRILWNATEIYRGRLNVRTEADAVSNETWHKVETVDGYEKLMKGADRDINWLRNQQTYTCDVDYAERDVLTFRSGQQGAWRSNDVPILQTTYDQKFIYYARVEKTVPNATANLLVGIPFGRLGKGGWYMVSQGATTSVIARSWQDAGYDLETFEKFTFICDSNISGQFALNDNAVFSSATCNNVFSGFFTGKICGLDNDSFGFYYYMMRDQIYREATFRHTRMRRLDETIKNIMQQIDPDLETDASSFTDFDSWCELLCAAVSDMKLNIDQSSVNLNEYNKRETSNRAIREEISWSKLWEMLSSPPYNFFYYLENVGGTNMLRVRHISSIVKTAGSFNLTNYKGVNWSDGKTRYQRDAVIYNRIVRNTLAERIDFQGVDVILPDIEDGEEQSIDLTGIMTDLLAIYHNPNEYPEKGMVIVGAEIGIEADYKVPKGLGVLSGENETNVLLALTTLDDESKSTGDRPALFSFTQAEINTVLTTVDQERLRKLQAISAPVRTPDEVDFNSLVTTSVDDIEPIELSIPLDGTQGHAIILGRY